MKGDESFDLHLRLWRVLFKAPLRKGEKGFEFSSWLFLVAQGGLLEPVQQSSEAVMIMM